MAARYQEGTSVLCAKLSQPMQIPWQPISYWLLAVVITVTIVTTGVILFAAITGRTGDPGVERDE